LHTPTPQHIQHAREQTARIEELLIRALGSRAEVEALR